MAARWGSGFGRERVSGELGERNSLAPELVDVPIGAGDVLAARLAVGEVWGVAAVGADGFETAFGLGRVEHAGHAFGGIDLQGGIGEQVVCLSAGGKHAAGELPAGVVGAVAVGAGGRAADVFAGGEPLLGGGELPQAQQPGLEGVLVGEAGGVGAGVAEGDLDLHVAVLDRASDQAAWPPDDEPGQCAAQPGRHQHPAIVVGWDQLRPAAAGAVGRSPR
jgi:hypothetical protein